MPTISMFYGILIRMFFKDIERHHRPHIHADYQGHVGTYAIDDGELLAGNLPPAKHKLVETLNRGQTTISAVLPASTL